MTAEICFSFSLSEDAQLLCTEQNGGEADQHSRDYVWGRGAWGCFPVVVAPHSHVYDVCVMIGPGAPAIINT